MRACFNKLEVGHARAQALAEFEIEATNQLVIHSWGCLTSRPYRPKINGRVERLFRYIREDFLLGGQVRTMTI